MRRYKFVTGSQSGHCCFDFTVVDTSRPVMLHGENYKNHFEPVCECYDKDGAELITNALNAAPANS